MAKIHDQPDSVRELLRRLRGATAEEHAGAHRLGRGSPSRILLIGEDNPQSLDPAHALYDHPPNAAGARLRDILSRNSNEYLAIWRANLCPSGKWGWREARASVNRLVAPRRPWDVVVLLGSKVARATCEALDLSDSDEVAEDWVLPAFEKFKLAHGPFAASPVTLLALPHPSGRCRAWNDPGAADYALNALQSAVAGA